MSETRLERLADLGQAVWLDYIRRSLITSGELQDYVDQGLRGVTSNPSIFEKAIAGSTDYDEELEELVALGQSVDEIYEALAIGDIQRAADVLRPVYEETDGIDGYVSLEVNPHLAHDTEGTIAEVRRLFAAVDRPNVMIKVPATPEGMPAIETLIAEGINVNVTLMFSLEGYDAVAEAYIAGLEKLAADGGDLKLTASVASFFVSRVDVKVDRMLDELDSPAAQALKGKIGIANAKMAYQRFQETFAGERWERLAAHGARVQRVLWASTSTKDPAYPDTLYVDNLIGPHTVNTLPPATLQALKDHGTVALTVERDLDQVRTQLAQLAELGIDLDRVTDELLQEGVDKFIQPFDDLLETIAEKKARLKDKETWTLVEAELGPYREAVDGAVEEMGGDDVVSRIWKHDHTVWKPDPTEITDRLGWLHVPEVMRENVARLDALVRSVREDGYTHALLLGMGGSSLAPELFSVTFGYQEGYLNLEVLDSTDPGAVWAYTEELDPARTLFIVATKSGTTVETLSFFKFFYSWAAVALGEDEVGDHFVAITDPGSELTRLAEQYDFRTVFVNDPNIGGRYSALSFFGLVPAALVGVDVARLLENALTMACACDACVAAPDNPGALLGATLAELARAGRDKVTFVTSPQIAAFGDWVEQLIAESTGKSGRGLLPVVREPLGPPDVYGEDRLFVHLRLQGDERDDAALQALEAAGHPVLRLHLRDRYDLGGQFFLWELATAVAGHRMDIHPFNQPNVESAKARARDMVEAYRETGALPDERPALSVPGITVYGDVAAGDLAGALETFLEDGEPAVDGDAAYVALQAFVRPTPETTAALQELRLRLRGRYRAATTFGYGPRFLHSTGQLHKGDAGQGLFIQFTADHPEDVAIPDEAGEPESSITFGVLILAQALGDRRALLDAGRRVIRFHLGKQVVGGLDRLGRALE